MKQIQRPQPPKLLPMKEVIQYLSPPIAEGGMHKKYEIHFSVQFGAKCRTEKV